MVQDSPKYGSHYFQSQQQVLKRHAISISWFTIIAKTEERPKKLNDMSNYSIKLTKLNENTEIQNRQRNIITNYYTKAKYNQITQNIKQIYLEQALIFLLFRVFLA